MHTINLHETVRCIITTKQTSKGTEWAYHVHVRAGPYHKSAQASFRTSCLQVIRTESHCFRTYLACTICESNTTDTYYFTVLKRTADGNVDTVPSSPEELLNVVWNTFITAHMKMSSSDVQSVGSPARAGRAVSVQSSLPDDVDPFHHGGTYTIHSCTS